MVSAESQLEALSIGAGTQNGMTTVFANAVFSSEFVIVWLQLGKKQNSNFSPH
jgi:hypothetical protein